MRNRHNHARKTVVTYTIYDLVSVHIPAIDILEIRLPAKIIQIKEMNNGHELYQLLTERGILEVMVAGHDLKPSNITNNCPAEKLGVKVSLHTAAFAYTVSSL